MIWAQRETSRGSQREGQKRVGEKIQVEQDCFRKYREQRKLRRTCLKRNITILSTEYFYTDQIKERSLAQIEKLSLWSETDFLSHF